MHDDVINSVLIHDCMIACSILNTRGYRWPEARNVVDVSKRRNPAERPQCIATRVERHTEGKKG